MVPGRRSFHTLFGSLVLPDGPRAGIVAARLGCPDDVPDDCTIVLVVTEPLGIDIAK